MINGREIRHLIEQKNLLDNYIDIEKQLTPNGFDLTAGKIFTFDGPGSLDFSNSQRSVPQGKEIMPVREDGKKFGWWKLGKGAYKVRTNESINLPNNLVALAFSRTSLLRIGAFTQHGVWDAGFKGKGEFILVVEDPMGINLKENARIAQLIFLKVEDTEAYEGIYKGLA